MSSKSLRINRIHMVHGDAEYGRNDHYYNMILPIPFPLYNEILATIIHERHGETSQGEATFHCSAWMVRTNSINLETRREVRLQISRFLSIDPKAPAKKYQVFAKKMNELLKYPVIWDELAEHCVDMEKYDTI